MGAHNSHNFVGAVGMAPTANKHEENPVTVSKAAMAALVMVMSTFLSSVRTMGTTVIIDGFQDAQFGVLLEQLEEGHTAQYTGWKQSMTWILAAGAHVVSHVDDDGGFATKVHGHTGPFAATELQWPCRAGPIRVTAFAHGVNAPCAQKIKDRVDERDVLEVVLRHNRVFVLGPGVHVVARLSWRGKTATQCYLALQQGRLPETSICIKLGPEAAMRTRSGVNKEEAPLQALDIVLKIAGVLGCDVEAPPSSASQVTRVQTTPAFTPGLLYAR